ncbi:titin homolog isoform X4 [Nasonia vitripennis]|uniref:LIM zinc-binding domain-containing protein n=1 Tax=Nasonia vitripennis TaxID=7425 RepID=A0A7M7QY48_NASVI|nr:titin homolog isoform X4 [Nasonia vitripennis]
MADVATKNKSMSVVSNNTVNSLGKTKLSDVCGVQSNNGLIDLDHNGLSNASNNKLITLCSSSSPTDEDEDEDDLILANNTRNELDSQDDKSLQELIESELALRICASSQPDPDDTEEDEPSEIFNANQPEIVKKIILEPRQLVDPLDVNHEFIVNEIDHYTLIGEPYEYSNGHVSPEPKDDDAGSPSPPEIVEELVSPVDEEEVFDGQTETTETEVTTTTTSGPSLPSAFEASAEPGPLDNEDQSQPQEDDQPASVNTLSDSCCVVEEATDEDSSKDTASRKSVISADKYLQEEELAQPQQDVSESQVSVDEQLLKSEDDTHADIQDDVEDEDSTRINDIVEDEVKENGLLSDCSSVEQEVQEPEDDSQREVIVEKIEEIVDQDEPITLKEASGVDEKACSFYSTESESPARVVDNDESVGSQPTVDVTDYKLKSEVQDNSWMTVEEAVKESGIDIVVTQGDESLQERTNECSDNFYSQEGHFENYLEKSKLEDESKEEVAPLATPDEISDISNACDDSESREEVITTSSVVSTTTKKKKKIEGGAGSDASPNHTKTKKTKKSKKSELEKENISVKKKIKSKESTKESMHTGSRRPSAEMIEISGEDDLSNVNVKSLTQTYVSETSRVEPEKPNKEVIATGVSIKQLCRSFGDVSNMNEGERTTLGAADTNRFQERAKSTGDLRLFEQERSGKYFNGRDIVFATVNVKALRASYCNLANLRRADNGEAAADRPPRRHSRGSIGVGLRPRGSIFEKSSFNKFDALSKKSATVLHVRSVDAGKVQQQLNSVAQNGDANPNCRSCGKVVFQMEQTKAESLVWHKNCFRCVQCGKQLNVDNYESHEATLYCKPHFKELFLPKPVEETDQPTSDKPDLGLEELSSLNVKSRFQVFEKANETTNDIERSPSQVAVKRSPSILSKLAKFQAKGMDIGVADESLNGIPYEESSESEEEIDEEETEELETETTIVKAKRGGRERPISFTKMDDIKNRWETTSQQGRRESQREARKEEIAGIRSRLFMGKQGKMKEMYQQAVADSERITKINAAEEIQHATNARSIKERFERGEPIAAMSDDEQDAAGKTKAEKPDEEILAAGISRKSRSLFLEMDATAAKTGRPVTPNSQTKPPVEAPRRARDAFMSRQVSDDVVRSTDTTEDVQVDNFEISSKFKFFERYREPEKTRKQFRITPPRDGQVKMDSPDREIYRDPDVVRAEDRAEEVVRTDTARKMLSIFRQMEENATKEDLPDGPKPLKRFTPPPEDKFAKATASESDEEEDEAEESEDEEHNPNYVRASDKVEDEFLKQAQNAARAKTLRAKFEHWETTDGKTTNHHVAEMDIAQTDGNQPSIESASSLRARFESLGSQPVEAPRAAKVKVNRFVEMQTNCMDVCESCEKKVYPLEKVETNNKIFHKQCFRCLQCNCILRMDTFTLNNGKLYCIPHFKQLFITRGNYDEGFGVDPHKNKWSATAAATTPQAASAAPIAVSNGDV